MQLVIICFAIYFLCNIVILWAIARRQVDSGILLSAIAGSLYSLSRELNKDAASIKRRQTWSKKRELKGLKKKRGGK